MERAIESIEKSHNKVLDDNDDQNHHVDRLSDLPDGVICHILNFLGTKRSVQTSILSKRWTTLWAHVPVLDLYYYEYDRSKAMSFLSTVCRNMLRHKVQSLNTFRLTYSGGGHRNYELETCIATAVERNVQIIYLQGYRVEVPRCLLTCETLVDLTICRGVSIPPTAFFSLPKLKKLHLSDLDYEVDFTRLLSGCPVLEELCVTESVAVELPRFLLTSKTLVVLTIGRGIRIPPTAPISLPKLKKLGLLNFDYVVDFTRLLSGCPVLEKLCTYVAVEWPLCLLTSKFLVDLTIGTGVSIPPTAPISLPKLKRLHLLKLDYEIDFTRLLSSCPVLEELYIIFYVAVELPQCLLTSKTLVDLTIKICMSIPPSAPISLPNLKKLDLWNLECEVDFTRLLSGCPVLEELSIGRITTRDPRGCFISSPTLKRLTIIDLLDHPDYMVTINTPALQYLQVQDISSKNISISPCTSLVEADIFIRSLHEPADDFYHRCVKKLLNVKCLKLTGSCDKMCGELMLGSIGNLTKLKLWAPWCFLTKFFETAHHLQVLTIVEQEKRKSKHWMEPTEERYACPLYSLRIVRIRGFLGKEQSFNMVRYILRNAQVLERMEINFPYYVRSKERCDLFQKITRFPRESKKCEFVISSE